MRTDVLEYLSVSVVVVLGMGLPCDHLVYWSVINLRCQQPDVTTFVRAMNLVGDLTRLLHVTL